MNLSEHQPFRLAVIIVSYNTCDLLVGCLRALLHGAAASADQLTLDVIVVDNASTDGSAEMVAHDFPQVRLFALDRNLGFTGANNLALAALGLLPESGFASLPSPTAVLLLNPDTEIAADALVQMAHVLADDPQAGACGAHLTYGDGRFQHGAFRFPSLAQLAFDLFPLHRVPGFHRLYDSPINGRYPQYLWQGDRPFAVDFVLGAALMVRADAIRQVGGLDDTYFMYCEEMDWCLRLHQAGWGVVAVPTAYVVHHEGQSSRQVRWPSFVRLWRSRLRFYAKYPALYPRGYLFVVRMIVRSAMLWRQRQALRQYAAGELTGDQVGEALAAYRAVRLL